MTKYTGIRRIQLADLKIPEKLPLIDHELEIFLLSMDTKQWPPITVSESGEIIDGLKRVAFCVKYNRKSLNGIQEK